MKRAAVTIPLLVLALAGCTAGPTPTNAPIESPVTTPTPTQTPTDAGTAGDCGPTDGTVPGIPVIYSFFTGIDTTVTVSYTAFNLDGTTPTVTEVINGPVWTKVGYACTDAASSSVWTLTAAADTTDSVSCALAFGGKLVKTDSAYAESADPISITADCSGNPGM